MLKEEDAKQMLCPQTFAVPETRDQDGNGILQGGPWKCVGSQCMAWRWIRSHGHAAAIGYGYCGLAGKPEA